MMPFECFKTYIALKTHFTKADKYDFIQNRTQRIRAKEVSFYEMERKENLEKIDFGLREW